MPSPLASAHAVTKLPCADLERARQWYRDRLGLEPAEERTGGLRYLLGSTEFHLFASSGRASGESTQMGFEVEDLDVALAVMVERGVEFEHVETDGLDAEHGDVVTAPDNYPSKGTGERGAFFRDSEGNLLALGQPTR